MSGARSFVYFVLSLALFLHPISANRHSRTHDQAAHHNALIKVPQGDNISRITVKSLKTIAQTLPVYSTCKKYGSVAVAFDDGPYDYTKRIQQTLDQNGVKGTFFMNGNNFRCIYSFADELKARFNKGHQLASHTWSHVDLATLDRTQLNRQFKLVEDAFVKILGVKPLYFRPPYGSYNDDVLDVAKTRGYKGAILWDYDSGDSFDPAPSYQDMIAMYKSYFQSKSNTPTSITLNHDFSSATVDHVIPTIVPYLKQKGYELDTIATCLNFGTQPSDWYLKVGEPGNRDNTWTCDGTPDPGVP